MASILESSEARAFRDAGRAFCTLVDARNALPVAEWLGAIHAALPRLYSAALALPDVEPDTDWVEHSSISHAEWKTLWNDIAARIDRWDCYWEMDDPYDDSDDKPVCGSLADDLSDIFRDVSDGLALERDGGSSRPCDVLWQWRFDFRSHWSAHAVSALRALRWALIAHAGSPPESPAHAPREPDAGAH